LLIPIAFAEIGLRLLFRNNLAELEVEKNLAYRYDPELGWFPAANSNKRLTFSRTITATHNSEGFRGPEPVKNHKPGIIFLGDSFVWGFDVEVSERFTEKLQAKHPEWAIYNFGVSGYGTDQEYLLLRKYFDQYQPAAVFLVICGDNDNEDNAWNFRDGYYKPYFTLQGGGLKLNGVPVPKSGRTFFAEHKLLSRPYLTRLLVGSYYKLSSPPPVKNEDPPTGALLLDMRSYVTNKGASFAVGMQQWHPDLEKFLQNYNIPHVDLTTTNPAHRYTAFGKHWTPEGHSLVADKIDQFLSK
jgi:hypothetical protein